MIKLGNAIYDSWRLGFQNAQIDVVFWDEMSPGPPGARVSYKFGISFGFFIFFLPFYCFKVY